jgi:hypothetical protein
METQFSGEDFKAISPLQTIGSRQACTASGPGAAIAPEGYELAIDAVKESERPR